MLKTIPIICSSGILILALTVQGYAGEHFPFLAEVSKDSVNVRAGSNTNFEKIDKLSRGTMVVVLGRSYEWYKIQPLSTTKAYIRSDYLQVKEGGIVAEVLGNIVHVRASPSSDSASLGQVKKGTLVKVLEQVRETGGGQKTGNLGWCRIAPVAGTAAWVQQDFLKQTSADVPAPLFITPVQWPTVSAPAAAAMPADKNK